MNNLVIYVHGKGGSAEETEHYKALSPKSEVIGFDYKSQAPWESREEFSQFFAGCHKRRNPIKWSVPTHILYSENDNLTSIEVISAFAKSCNADLTVMKNGEHWFHMDE